MAVGIGFGVGINAVIALYLGEGNEERADKAATQGLVCAAVHSVIMTAGSIAVMPSFLRVFTSSEEVLSYGIRYSRIAFLFAPVIMFAMAFEKIYQAVGKMKVTMTSLMCGCIANIILDPVLIFGIGPFPKMGIEGAALATGIGQLLPLIIYLVLYLVCPIRVRIRISDIKPDKYIIGKLYSIGIPGTLNLALPSLLISALNAILAAFAGSYIFVLGIYYKLQTFLYLSVNGIIQGMRPLIGFNYGAKEYKRVQKIFRVVLFMSVVIMAVGTLLCLTVPGALMGMFTDVPETIRVGETGTSDHQCRLYRFISVSSCFRGTGGNRKRDSVVDHFSLPLYRGDHSDGVFVKPSDRSDRCLACFLDRRAGDSGDICNPLETVKFI